MEIKNTAVKCPVCGEIKDVETFDFEWDGESLRAEMVCHNCGAQWDEYFGLTYKGYAHNGIDYDEMGKEMFSNGK